MPLPLPHPLPPQAEAAAKAAKEMEALGIRWVGWVGGWMRWGAGLSG